MTKLNPWYSVDDLAQIANLLKSWNAFWTSTYDCNLKVVQSFINHDSIWTPKELYTAIKAQFIYNDGLAIVSSPRGRLLIRAPKAGCVAAALFFKH